MKKLYEIIEELEAKIPDTVDEKLPELYYKLCDLYTLVSERKQRYYALRIIENINLPPLHPIKLNAELTLSSIDLNNMRTEEAHGRINRILANEISEISVLSRAKGLYAAILTYKGESKLALQFADEAIQIAHQTEETKLLSETYTYACYCYLEHDLSKSGQYGIKGVEYAKATGNNWTIGYATNALGHWAKESGAIEDSLNYFNAAYTILKSEGAKEYYASTIFTLADIYSNREDFNKAIAILKEAEAILAESDNTRTQIMCKYSIARCYRNMNNFTEAEQIYKEALSIAIEHNKSIEVTNIYALMGHLYKNMGDDAQGIVCYESALETLGDSIRPSVQLTIYKNLHPLYKRTGAIDKAYNTLEAYANMRFKILDENRIKETTQLQAKYETEKRESEIQRLSLLQIESELKAIKAQMNPHFIFNALNSIQEIFFLGDKRLANKHLSRFSVLMRNILKASGRKTITLQEEIEMLQEYLALEALRFGENFTFSVTADDDTDTYTLDVPPMILQPFAENAVKHGLLHKEGEQRIEIHFSFDENEQQIVVTVADNGIGRKASATINQNRQGHQSFATSAIEKRFEILNSTSPNAYSFTYEDLIDKNGKALGTKVILVLPIEN